MNIVFNACCAFSNTLLAYFLGLLEVELRDNMKPVAKLTDVVELHLKPKPRQAYNFSISMTRGSQTSMTIAFASCVLHTVGLQKSEDRVRSRLMQDNLIRSLEKSFERSSRCDSVGRSVYQKKMYLMSVRAADRQMWREMEYEPWPTMKTTITFPSLINIFHHLNMLCI